MNNNKFESYTILKHVTGDNHSQYTGIRDVSMTVDGDATLHEMFQAFRNFLLAIGYAETAVSEFVEAE